jgi:hypothetical protein
MEASSNSSTFWLGRTVALAKRCPLLALSGRDDARGNVCFLPNADIQRG